MSTAERGAGGAGPVPPGAAEDRRAPRRTAPVQRGAGLLAFVLVAMGIVGFIPGLTQNLNRLAVLGPNSGAQIFDLVRVSVVINIIHVVVGGWGFWSVRRGPAASIRFLEGTAALFFLMSAWGVETRPDSPTNLLPVDAAGAFVDIVIVVVALAFMIFLNRTGSDVVRQTYASPRRSDEGAAWQHTPVAIAPPIDGSVGGGPSDRLRALDPARTPTGEAGTGPGVDADNGVRVGAVHVADDEARR